MAEYYPLLAKAVASLPNSTSDSRKLVYERARKALIGQLRTLHPPVPDDDIARESQALDRAVERLEAELGSVSPPGGSSTSGSDVAPAPFVPPKPVMPFKPLDVSKPVEPPMRFPASGGALGPAASKPLPPLRTKLPSQKPSTKPASGETVVDASDPAAPISDAVKPIEPAIETAGEPSLRSEQPRDAALDAPSRPQRAEPQRPFAPQPPKPKGTKRPLWIIPVGIAIVVLLVGVAAYKLRDKPILLTRAKPVDQSNDASKIVERVGAQNDGAARKAAEQGTPVDASRQQAEQSSANAVAAVAGRAALLVEAPDEPTNKVKTYLGTVVWRLDNVSDGQNQTVGLAVRADIDLPDDKLKATVVFQKNVEASLPASHTMKVRFMVQPGSATGNVKQINVPQMRREDSATGDSLDGVSVTIVDNSFLIGLTPGNSEAANLDMLRAREWIDVPMLLSNSKIAKLTFEKTAAGQRELQEAITAWAKQ